MQETPQQYSQRILSYVEGADPLRILQATPKKVASLLKGKTKKQLMRRPASDKWSVAEIMAHFADVEIAIGWRLRLVLTANAVSIQAYDQDAWAATFGYARRDPRQSLALFQSIATQISGWLSPFRANCGITMACIRSGEMKPSPAS
jgi:hypothetical protein